MPEDQDLADARRLPSEPRRNRTRRHRRRPALLRYWWIIPTLVFIMAAPWIWSRITNPFFKPEPVAGYISDPAQLEQEYLQLTGKPLQDPAAMQQFDQATRYMQVGNYADSVNVLETVAKTLAVPAVFNDLGLLYMKIDDGPHAVNAFRDALARDHDYPPVQANLKSLKLTAAMEPGSTELEPNDTSQEANAIWLDKPLEAVIGPNRGDLDCYWFIAPRPPRDRISIQVSNRSITLSPRLRVFDSSGKLLSGLREASGPGASVRFDFSPPPNSFYSIKVDGNSGTLGAYTLSVSSLRAFDIYEPNDDILNATHIPGQSVSANIMDADDTDFFSFTSPVSGDVSIDITAIDATLIPALATFGPDQRNIGFGPELDKPGASLHHVMKVEANKVYYLQVFGKHETTGAYTLSVK